MVVQEPEGWWQSKQTAVTISPGRFFYIDPDVESTPIYNRLRRLRGETRAFDGIDNHEPVTHLSGRH